MQSRIVVGMLDSVHLARWLKQFVEYPIDFHLFPSTPNRHIHEQLSRLIEGKNLASFSLFRGMRSLALPLAILDLLAHNRIRGMIIRNLINRSNLNFDFIHAHETQHAGYLVESALKKSTIKPALILSIWGSDLYWFTQFKHHKKRIENVLSITDKLIVECKRDIALADQFGYSGEAAITSIASGGFEESTFKQVSDSLKPSERNIVLVKGYTGFVGRADLALYAVEKLKDLLHSFEIIVYSTDFRSRKMVRKIRRRSTLNIVCYPKHAFNHESMMSLFKKARIHIGISSSDGMPGSLREAMVSGCFPIQTDTSCADEWITDGLNGFIVPIEDEHRLELSIKRAISETDLVDNAAVLNLTIIRKHANNSNNSKTLESIYS